MNIKTLNINGQILLESHSTTYTNNRINIGISTTND